jgi:DNA-binding response OmpR family regulator
MKVLIVDHREDALQAFELLLRRHSCQTITANDSRDAFEKAADEHPDVILLDVGKPRRRSGIQVCRRIRSMRWGRKPLILGVGGWTPEEEENAALSAGFDHYLPEPMEHQALLALLNEGK